MGSIQTLAAQFSNDGSADFADLRCTATNDCIHVIKDEYGWSSSTSGGGLNSSKRHDESGFFMNLMLAPYGVKP